MTRRIALSLLLLAASTVVACGKYGKPIRSQPVAASPAAAPAGANPTSAAPPGEACEEGEEKPAP